MSHEYNQQDWGRLFDSHFKSYQQARPKRAEYIVEFLREIDYRCDTNTRFLEEGAFSAKDLAYLQRAYSQGSFIALDYDIQVVRKINAKTCLMLVANAFALPIAASSIEISFHSGLIINFKNADVRRILKQQYAVTKDYMFVFAHNQLNLVDRAFAFFRCYIEKDNLYDFRRFNKRGLRRLCSGMEVVRIEYVDNMLINFSRRHWPALVPIVTRSRISRLPFFYNEIVVVIQPQT